MKLRKIFISMLKEAEYEQGTFGFEYDENSVISDLDDLNKLIKWLSRQSDKEYKGSIDFQFNQSVTTLPSGLKIKGDVNLKGCNNLKSLPPDLSVGGDLNLKHTPLAKGKTLDQVKQMCPKVNHFIL